MWTYGGCAVLGLDGWAHDGYRLLVVHDLDVDVDVVVVVVNTT